MVSGHVTFLSFDVVSGPMDEMQAARERHSVRRYTTEPLSEEHVKALNEAIGRINAEAGLDARLVTNEPKGFGNVILKTIGFRNCVNYIAMIGPNDESLNEKCGYYGERLVLLAQSLGLRTCWALLCSKKQIKVADGERFCIGISVGYGEDDGVQHKDKPVSEIADLTDAPEWFRKGIECVMLAPSGRNKQPISFTQKDGKVSAHHKDSGLTRIDCGIAKYHFELGAGKDSFEWASE